MWSGLAVRLLGAMSLAMGACLVTPARAARLFGLGARSRLVAVIAARDVAIGLGLFSLLPGGTRFWLLVHAVADVGDGTVVLGSLRNGSIARARGVAWLALAAGGALTALILASGACNGSFGRVGQRESVWSDSEE